MHIRPLTTRLRLSLSWAVTFGALVIASCGGGSSESDLTDRVIADDELMTMVLPKEELGGEYSEFQLGEDSGFQYADDKVDDATDKDDERADLERFDFVKAYDESYFSFDALLVGEGMLGLGTHLDLYQDAVGASGDFDDSMADIENEIGVPDEDGSVLESYEEFRAPDIGDDAVGVVFRGKLSNQGEGNLPLTATGVQFRRGRIVANAILIRIDDVEMQEDAVALAEKFDERIVAVLKGELEPRPTATAGPTPGVVMPTEVLDSFRGEYSATIEALGTSTTITARGSFVAPDRFECTLDAAAGVLGTTSAHVIVIGNEAWIDSGQGWRSTRASDFEVEDALSSCPVATDFWSEFDLAPEGVEQFPSDVETKNGVQARHYDLDQLVDALRELGFAEADLEGVTINDFDYWVAEDGGWSLAARMDISVEGTNENVFGLPVAGGGRMVIEVNILDANDPSISIEAPVVAP